MAHELSDLEALRQDARRAYFGDAWHGPALREAMAGVDPALAMRRVIPGAHTIWEIVLHLTAWTREVARRVAGADPVAPEDWPRPDLEGENQAWRLAVRELEAAQAQLEDALTTVTAERLAHRVGGERDVPLGTGVSVGTMVRGLLQHHAYHAGQIVLLRRAAWSSAGGTE